MFKLVSKLIWLTVIFTVFYPGKLEPSTNNHGISGLINMPNARFSEEGTTKISLFRGDPDRKLNLTFSPFNWMEGGFYYADITGKEYGNGFKQSYKDKGFNVKFRLKEQGDYPALALGFNDFAGTGLYGSEYLVSSYKFGKIDFSLGLGWGNLAGSATISNPLKELNNRFSERDNDTGLGGDFNLDNYFAGANAGIFGGIEYEYNSNLSLKIEYDTTELPGRVGYEAADLKVNFGLDYAVSDNLKTSISFERGNYIGIKFLLTDNISSRKLNQFNYEEVETNNKLAKLVVNLQNNNISLENLSYAADGQLVIGIRQTSYQNIEEISSVIYSLNNELKLSNKDEIVLKNYSNGLEVTNTKLNTKNVNNYRNISEPINLSRTIYQKEGEFPRYFQTLGPRVRTFIGGREGFLYYGLFLEHISKYMFSDDFFIDSQLAFSIANNFDDLTIPPVTTYPNQVRSDIKDYLNGIDEGLALKRLSINKFTKLGEDSYLYLTGGVLEEMFNGFGLEYLKHSFDNNFSYGFEIFRVKKRGYEYDFEMQDYSATTGHANLYYKFGNTGLFTKLSWGKYLAGDEGSTLKVWKRFRNGAEMGAYASFTDVTFEQYGEGSFDKGIFFKVPFEVFGQRSMNSYGWKPLTKDPAAKLNKSYELYNELIRFN